METPEVKTEEKKTEVHKTTFGSLIWNFCDYTSAHGLGRISGVKHWTRTVFWSLLFIGAVTMLCIQVYTLLSKYESRPLTTLVTVQKETSLNFPMVTFCNYNALKNFSVKGNNNNNLTAFVQDLHDLNGTNVDNLQINSTSKPTSDSSSTANSTEETWQDDNFENPDQLDSQFLRGEEMAVYLAREDVQVLTLLGHQFDEMVLSCTFRGVSCRNYTTSYWTTFWHYKYGNCFVFNRGEVNGVEVDILKSNNPGPSQGLNLEINIEQDEYIGPLTPEAGIRVDISPQGAMPFPLDKGVSLAPGYATMIGLRKMIKERKDPFKNNRCLDTISRDNNNLYTRLFNVSYSSTACKESCLAYNQLERCGCMEYRFPAEGQKICGVKNIKSIKCLSKVQELYKSNELNCTTSCPPPCRLEEFKISSSFAIWPSEKYEPFYQESVEKKDKYLFTKSGSHRRNVLKLQVFFEELDVEFISEQRSYELVAFVSDIGGQLGLWIGFSVLTIAEFLELMILLCHLAVKKCSVKEISAQKQTPIVREVDNAIQSINHYPVDNVVCFVNTYIVIHWITIYPVDSAIRPAFEQLGPGNKRNPMMQQNDIAMPGNQV